MLVLHMIDLLAIPHTPGCYLFSDTGGAILYVGKAKDLRKRVTSYFQKKDHDVKTKNLVALVASVDLMMTNTEVEALLLENNLIKKHRPKYNIDLKDAKRYAYIEISREKFPRIGIARQIRDGEAVYFGPFVSAAERDAILRVIKRIFLLRSCRKLPKRSCLRYHMHSCSAPCVGAVSEEDYHLLVDRASALLRGKSSELLDKLRTEMAMCSHRQEFEKALLLRNQITAVERLAERQHVERPEDADQDVIAYTIAGDRVYLMVFSVEKGRLCQKQEFSFDYHEDFFEEFLVLYYADREPPQELIVSCKTGEGMADYLSRKKGQSVLVTVPKIGGKKKLIGLVEKNIEHAFMKNELKVKDLQASLGLIRSPDVVECFDISHLSGTSMVGSMVQFRSGIADKKNYRHFRIKTVEGIDDVASIAEIVKRRYYRLIKEHAGLPDLIIIDGGKGQLSAATGVLEGLGLKIPVMALAKREEEVYLPGEMLPRRLDTKGMALHFLQEIRNEAHRFAISYNRLLRSRSLTGAKGRSGRMQMT
jgi:excinuclease ABC subunit C